MYILCIGFPRSFVGSQDALGLLQVFWLSPARWTSHLPRVCSTGRPQYSTTCESALATPSRAELMFKCSGPSVMLPCYESDQ